MSKITVLSLGGSIVAPGIIDTAFLTDFVKATKDYLDKDLDRKLIIVTGGGAIARDYQNAVKAIIDVKNNDILDSIGIKATHLNAILVKSLYEEYSSDNLVTSLDDEITFSSRVLVAGGWKPGFSTDTVAAYLAQKFSSKLIVNLSNIKKVYTADPKVDKNAKPLDNISWDEFTQMVGGELIPGKNTPFDPIASVIAKKENMSVICADGRNIENTMAILNEQDYIGTLIS